MSRLSAVILAVLTTCALVATLVVTTAPAGAASGRVEKAQRQLNRLGCNAGPVDGDLGRWTRSAIIRFQSRHKLAQSGRLNKPTRTRLYAGNARRCDARPVPGRSGTGRRIVISQRQNCVWLVGPKGAVVAQGGMVDLPSELAQGRHRTGSYCGRDARIKRNNAASGTVWLKNFVRFAPCGIGFHRIPTYKSNGNQIHPDWYLGTNVDRSHGCIRLSQRMSLRVWKFTKHRTVVRVV